MLTHITKLQLSGYKPVCDDADRLAALHRLEVMDTPAEAEFDELVSLAASICEVPISLLSFIDEKRQWYKAGIGMTESETPVAQTYCQYTLHQENLLIIEDTQEDTQEDTRQKEYFPSHASVIFNPSVRFYAGISIKTSNGHPVGTLCVADIVPRRLSSVQIVTLKLLARQANARIELREQRSILKRALTDAEQARERLAVSENRFKTFMDSAPFLGFLKDSEGHFLFYNRLLAERFGITAQEWLGKSVQDVFPAEIASSYHENDLAVMKGGKLHVADEASFHADGSTCHWRSYKFPCPDGDAFLLGGISMDITEDVRLSDELFRSRAAVESANAQLRELATTDALTGLPNRRAFDERLIAEFLAARRSQRPLSIVLLDIDRFKQLNDRFGHTAGDDTLRQFAKLLREAGRANDFVARYGGEEFVFLLPDTDEQQATELGQRILHLLHMEAWPLEPITASAGVTCINAATPSPQHLVTLADEALYVAKRSGRDRIVAYGSYSKQIGVHIEIPLVPKPL